jgi:hypothetical protein
MSKPTPAGYQPSGSQCAQCQHAARDCSALKFAAMRPAGRPYSDGVQRVACSGYVRAGIPTLDECRVIVAPLVESIKRKGNRWGL